MEPLLSVVDASTAMVRGQRFSILIDRGRIRSRVREIGADLSAEYAGRRPVLLGVLNGAFIFLADLMREMTIDCDSDFLKLSSYGEGMTSTGTVRERNGLERDLAGRHVIVVEDIVDSGRSLRYVLDRLTAEDPASVRVVTLLDKPDARVVDVYPDHVGFAIPEVFVVGYGLDHGQVGRNLPDIFAIDQD